MSEEAKIRAARIAAALTEAERREIANELHGYEKAFAAVRKHAPDLEEEEEDATVLALCPLLMTDRLVAVDFTDAERVFIARMAPHVAAGKSFEEAAQAVLADDQRIYAALHGPERQGLVDGLCAAVYHGARSR